MYAFLNLKNEYLLESFADFNIAKLHSSTKGRISTSKRSLWTVGKLG